MTVLYNLLGWDVESQRPHVNLLVGVYAWHDEKDARTSSTAAEKSTQSKDDNSLVFLNDFDGEAKRKRDGDKDQEDGEEGDEVSTKAWAFVAGCEL